MQLFLIKLLVVKQLGHKIALVVFCCSLPYSVHSAYLHQQVNDIAIEFELPLLKVKLGEGNPCTKKTSVANYDLRSSANVKPINNSITKPSSFDGLAAPRTAKPNTLKLSQYKGKVLYIDFWASWCNPCLVSMPLLNDLRNKYHDVGFEIIAVNIDENPEFARHFLNKMHIDYPVVSDPQGRVAKLYSVNGLPSAYIVDSTGKVELIHKGFSRTDIHFLDAIVDKLVAEIE